MKRIFTLLLLSAAMAMADPVVDFMYRGKEIKIVPDGDGGGYQLFVEGIQGAQWIYGDPEQLDNVIAYAKQEVDSELGQVNDSPELGELRQRNTISELQDDMSDEWNSR